MWEIIMSSNSAVNAVQIEHLFEKLTKTDASIAELGNKVEEQGVKREEKYTQIAEAVKKQLASNSSDIKNLFFELQSVTKEHSNTAQKVIKNSDAILELERNYVTKNNLIKWFLGMVAFILVCIGWQDMQTKRYIERLESTISLSVSEKEQLNMYKHLLDNDLKEAVVNWKENLK